jgi:hypothetical protein
MSILRTARFISPGDRALRDLSPSTSVPGQTEKTSRRAYVFRSAPDRRHCQLRSGHSFQNHREVFCDSHNDTLRNFPVPRNRGRVTFEDDGSLVRSRWRYICDPHGSSRPTGSKKRQGRSLILRDYPINIRRRIAESFVDRMFCSALVTTEWPPSVGSSCLQRPCRARTNCYCELCALRRLASSAPRRRSRS